MIAIVILLRVLKKCSGENKLSNVRNFIIKRSGEGFTAFNGNRRTNFCGEKRTMELPEVFIFREL